MVNILHILYSFNAGGLENGVVNLINRLPSESFSHVICVLSRGKGFYSKINNLVKIYELNKKEGNDISIPISIASIIRKENIDIVHTRNWATLLEGTIGACIGRCSKLIHGEHGKEVDEVGREHFRRRVIKQLCYGFAKRIITVSHSLKNEICREYFISDKKIDPIINGVDCKKFVRADQYIKKQSRRKYGIPETAFVIGSVGRLTKVKNFEMLIKICETNRLFNHFFVIVGSGPEKEKLEEVIFRKKLNHSFLFTGEIEDIPEILGTFDVFLNCSHYEGISNTILEAMAMGIPIVAHDIGGTPEILQHYRTALLVKNNCAGGYHHAIRTLYSNSNLYLQISKEAEITARRDYSIERMVSRYHQAYRSIL